MVATGTGAIVNGPAPVLMPVILSGPTRPHDLPSTSVITMCVRLSTESV